MISELLDLDPTAVLAVTESLVFEQREREVDEVRLVLTWADLHSTDPGEGRTLGIARQAGLIATRRLAADALDLRYRLPLVWAAVQDLRLPVWVARKVASMSRTLAKDAAGLVDVAVAAAVDQSPGRVLSIAEAKVIEADLEAHRARVGGRRREHRRATLSPQAR